VVTSVSAPGSAAVLLPASHDVDERAVRAALAEVSDPEIPAISIVDLGIVHRVDVDTGSIRVQLLPTFIGCPAIEMIQNAVAECLASFGRPVEVDVTFEVPWTSERISPAGREQLRRAGFAPPTEPDDVKCPYCDSARVAMDSAFGPTLCRALYYCLDCRQPFEAFKAV
jgi:ring-1,2-phenylacetyl-CoA epoxidase subunit PaaD